MEKFARIPAQRKGPGDTALVRKQALHAAFHVDIDLELEGTVLQNADQLEARAIAEMGQPRVPVAARVLLADQSRRRAVEHRAPFFELEDACGRFHGQQADHAPVVEQSPAAHRVAKVGLPCVLGVHIAKRRCDAAFGHDRVCLAQQGFAH